ncbi:MAG TPA: AraC family transcriptional regulator [Blastocatellia bacterium]|nr:AraC family transcriptional regulator [Blastocatellia bacterium]
MDPNVHSTGSAVRATTTESYRRAIERVILAMRERLDEPLSLRDLAEVAIISPYHFDRVFRQMTGIPPCQFLGALRIQEAKRLLLTTRLRVTDICFEVGYNSLGSFLTRFTQLVGLTPRHLRRQAQGREGDLKQLFRSLQNEPAEVEEGCGGIKGEIFAPEEFGGVIFIGLFPTPIPQSKPSGCAVLTGSGSYFIPVTEEGTHYVLAAGFPWTEDPMAHLMTETSELCVGSSAGPVTVKDGEVKGDMDIVMRPLSLMDPPLLTTPPLLLNSWEGDIQVMSEAGPRYATASAGD